MEGASDPVLNVILISKEENLLYKTVIASADILDVTLRDFKYDCAFVAKYYSSPVGYFEYYVYDLKNKSSWKTRKLDELEVLDNDAFDLEAKEYYVGEDSTLLFKLQLVGVF